MLQALSELTLLQGDGFMWIKAAEYWKCTLRPIVLETLLTSAYKLAIQNIRC